MSGGLRLIGCPPFLFVCVATGRGTIMPLRPCAHPTCPELVRFPDRYCPKHAGLELRAKDSRPSARQRGYTTTWDKIRRHVLTAEPLCRRCAADGHAMIADLVHHKDHDPHNNNRDNLEPLCTSCHEKEHEGDRKKREGDKISARIPAGTGWGALRARCQNSIKGSDDGWR